MAKRTSKKFTCETAEDILADVLPTDAQMAHAWDYKPKDEKKSKIYWDEANVYAYLPIADISSRYEHNFGKVTYWYILQRSFLGSCSSHWNWGLWRMPNVRYQGPDVYPNGPADTLEEAGEQLVRQAIKACFDRYETGLPQVAGTFKLALVEVANCYQQGWRVTDISLARLRDLNALTHKLQQPGYSAYPVTDDRLLILFENKYEQYLWEQLARFHVSTPINVGVSMGYLYYVTPTHVVSDAINRLWLGMRALVPGTIVYDLERLSWTKLRTELYGFEPADPRSIRTGDGGLDFGMGHLHSPERMP